MEELSKTESSPSFNETLPKSPMDSVDFLSQPEEITKNPAQLRYDLNYDLNNVQRRKEEKEQQVRYLEISISNSYQVITQAAGLKLRRNRNIIKLHGSLRSLDQKERNHFEFDGDFKSQYIISGEDYKKYPQRHEAFTQLMRISLLQESFCFIGFSGVDPNFLTWIGWVRDILQKQAAKTPAVPDYKIYLIDIEDENDPADRMLFFENHSIVRIPLTKAEVLELIDPDKSRSEKVSIRDSIRFFLDYLAADEELTPFVPLKDLSREQDRKAVWRDLHFADPVKKHDIDVIKGTVEQLDQLADNVFLPDINHGHSFNQHSVLGAAGNQLNFYQHAPEQREWICRLVMHAAKDYFVPIYNVVEKEVIDMMLEFPTIREHTLALTERTISLDASGTYPADRPYETILRLAYRMQFDKLKAALDNWQPRGKGLLQKSGFLAMFDALAARELIENELNNYDNFTGEERLYAFEMLSYFKLSRTWTRDKKLDKTIGQYEHTGFRKLSDNFDYLQEQLAPKPEKILAYGKGRFSTGHSVQWVTFTQKEMALQYIMLLAESGIQLSLKQVYFQSAQKWYHVFKSGFELYPHPFLYYSVQLGGDDFLKRVGQDYAFSEKLVPQMPDLIESLFHCEQTAPAYIRPHTYYLLAELLNAVEPGVWQNSFLKSWKNGLRTDSALVDRHDPENVFFTNGIKYITDPDVIREIIKDCLEAIDEGKSKGIDYLYHLNFNQHFKVLKRNKAIIAYLQPQIDQIITGLRGKVDTNLFALGNIYSLLNTEQIETIQTILQNEDYSQIKHVRIWHIILFFVHKDKATVKITKEALLQHHALWYTGIEGTRISRGIESIDVSRLTKGSENSKGVKWTSKELSFLYHKIKDVLPLIQSVSLHRDGIVSFTNVLEDMLIFLLDHENKLQKNADFVQTLELTRELFNEQRDFDSPVQGLLSDDNSPVVWALNAINRQIRTQHLDLLAFSTLLSKCMLQHQPGLEASLHYIAAWISDKKNKKELEIFRPQFIQLLTRYLTNKPADTDIAFVYEKLAGIAYDLKSWEIDDPIIQQWLDKAGQSNFNNVKQLVLKRNSKK